MINVEYTDVLVLPVVIGLVEVAKRAGLPERLSPALALVLGVVGGVLYVAPHSIRDGIFAGIVMGLSSMGLYAGAKSTVGK